MYHVNHGVYWFPFSLDVASIWWEERAVTVITWCCAGCRWRRPPWPSRSRRTTTWESCWLKSRWRKRSSWSDGAERRRKNSRHGHTHHVRPLSFQCRWHSLVTTVKSCWRKMFGIYSGILRLTHHHLKQEAHRLPREALALPFGDGM